MDAEQLKTLIAACAAIVAFNSFLIARRTLMQTEQNVYLKFYELVQQHHSKEITELRECIYTADNKSRLDEVAEAAHSKGVTIKEYDAKFHSQISALANYYESLGMFLEYRWNKMPDESKNLMMAMLHNSVTKTWSEINTHKDAIYPNKRSPDWAHSFQWLNFRAREYRRKNKLE